MKHATVYCVTRKQFECFMIRVTKTARKKKQIKFYIVGKVIILNSVLCKVPYFIYDKEGVYLYDVTHGSDFYAFASPIKA